MRSYYNSGKDIDLVNQDLNGSPNPTKVIIGSNPSSKRSPFNQS